MTDGGKMNIAVCDDDKQVLFELEQLLQEYLGKYSVDCTIKICPFRSSMELLAQIENGRCFDLYLLDIIMPGLNGIKLAAKIRKADSVSKIVFLTSSSEYAVDSYSVDAFHYLLKPVQKEKLFLVLDKASADFNSTSLQSIVIKSQGTLCKILFRDLVYVEVVGRMLRLQQKDGTLTESIGTLSQIENLILSDKRFIKPHRSYIVNMDYVRELSLHGLTTGNLCIPVSRNTFKEVKAAYLSYFFPKEER